MSPFKHTDYTIAWICALPLEAAAARVMLDKVHDSLPQPSTDPNAYVLGELNVSAATVVSHMRSTFTRIEFGLMVGTGGGVPGESNDIRLGDVVISKPEGKYSGVIQYGYGKAVQGRRFEPTGSLNRPPHVLLTHVAQLEAKQMIEREGVMLRIVEKVLEDNPYMKGMYRQPRGTRAPHIHYGLIASGDQLMKNSKTRDRLARQHGILCFEMGAAGIMDALPALAYTWKSQGRLPDASICKRIQCGTLQLQQWLSHSA
ncbi:nucleoside phosphorylase domain-containing protein [Aspergillus desertorum]